MPNRVALVIAIAIVLFWVSKSSIAGALPEAVGASKSQGSLERMDFGKTPDGTPVELYVLTNGKMTAKVMTYGAILTELACRTGTGRRPTWSSASTRLAGYLAGTSAFRGHDRPGRQPDRQGAVHARRQGIQAGRQQRAQLAARRRSRGSTRSSGRRGRLGAGRSRRQADVHEPRRRGRLSGEPARSP